MKDHTLVADDPFTNLLESPRTPTKIEVSWWTRGGDPGPSYTSDKLDVTIQDGVATGSYIRARFDQEYDPPFRSEEFTGQVPADAWRDLLTTLAAERPFGTHYPSEDRDDLADALKDTIELHVNGHTSSKTLYESDKEELARSKAARNRLARILVETGTHRLRNRMRP